MKKINKIVITNFYGYKNIGDGAILDSAIKLLNKTFTRKEIHIHAATDFSAKILNNNYTKTFLHPYGIAIKTSHGPISDLKKVFRLIIVLTISLLYSFLGKIFPYFLPETGDYSYIKSIKDADTVLGIGGGYLRTKNKYKDYFGLVLTLLPIFIAHLYNKRILYLPMSYGNFASRIHEKIVFHLIKKDTIVFRDEISMQEFNKNSNKRFDTYLIPDLALFDKCKIKLKGKKDYIVLTARLWMDEVKQKKYEKELALFINYIWDKYKLKTIFIPMVWNKKEEDDTKVGARIKFLIKNKKAFEIIKVSSPQEVKKILSKAKLAICTRMHSAILSTIVKTPFITIAYEYKTMGFLKHLGLENWNININIFTSDLMKIKLDELLKKQYQKFINQLKISHKNISGKEDELIYIIKNFQTFG